MADSTRSFPFVRDILRAVTGLLQRAEVRPKALGLPGEDALADVDSLRAYVSGRLASAWLPLPEGEADDPGAADLAWAPVVCEALWSGPLQRGDRGDPLGAWLRGALAACLTAEALPQVFIPPIGETSPRGLEAFRYQQVGAALRRLFGDEALVRVLCDVVTPAEAFGEAVAEVLASRMADSGLEPGRGPDDPSVFAQPIYAAYAASGRELDPERTLETRMLMMVLEYMCLDETSQGLEQVLPYSVCRFDFEAGRVTGVTHERTEVRSAALPPYCCAARLADGQKYFEVAISTPNQRASWSVAQHIVVTGLEGPEPDDDDA